MRNKASASTRSNQTYLNVLRKICADAKARGVYKGRKATIDPEKIRKMKAGGIGPSAIAKALKIGRASVYRALGS
ncbi:DNA invertase Pin-like site-specific DNA recombinase [Bradyrhizobium sp. AZCC 1719]|uniref:helix-turn-helix domain-containing protein n=1 Tax=Bradyrhizobium sp. AZCC 1719 TaxID=3117028 RepID=UPI002FF213D5